MPPLPQRYTSGSASVCALLADASIHSHTPVVWLAGPFTLWLWAASVLEGSDPGRRSWARASCREACCGAT